SPALRDRRTRSHVFGKARVKAGREHQPIGAAMLPHQKTDRSFGGDMDGGGTQFDDLSRDGPPSREREAQTRVRRQRNARQPFRRKESDRGAERRRRSREFVEGMHHAVDVRMPSVGSNENTHQAARASATGASSSSCPLVSVVHVRISKVPSPRSATAVQLSTQSPQFT